MMDTGLPILTGKCVGCGFCCRQVRCYLGRQRHGEGDNCPSLVWNGSVWRCQLVLDNPELKTNPYISYDLHIGEGCCRPYTRHDLQIHR